jgi:hypothetical protein
MKTTLTLLALSASLMLAGCMTPGTPPANQVSNGEDHVGIWPGNVPHVDKDEPGNEPGRFNVTDFDQMVYFDRDCRTQMASQTPSALKSVGTTVLRTAVPTAILGGLGTGMGIKSVAAGAKGYTSYGMWANGSSAAGAGIGGGIDRHLTGDRYTQAGCVSGMVAKAQKKLGILQDVVVVFNADAVNGRSLKRPAGEASTVSVRGKPDPRAEEDQNPPHP